MDPAANRPFDFTDLWFPWFGHPFLVITFDLWVTGQMRFFGILVEPKMGQLSAQWVPPRFGKKISSGDIPACVALFQCSHHPAALAEPRGTLVEPW